MHVLVFTKKEDPSCKKLQPRLQNAVVKNMKSKGAAKACAGKLLNFDNDDPGYMQNIYCRNILWPGSSISSLNVINSVLAHPPVDFITFFQLTAATFSHLYMLIIVSLTLLRIQISHPNN